MDSIPNRLNLNISIRTFGQGIHLLYPMNHLQNHSQPESCV